MINKVVTETTDLPDHFPVMVIMERRPAKVSLWADYIWTAIGVTVGNAQEQPDKTSVTHLENDVQLHIHHGYQVKLYIDECDSYYRNLMSPAPRCFIVVREDEYEDAAPRPFIVSLSFDEAHAYLEGDDTVYAVDIPPELYRWMEAFVITHYCPEERIKRKRKDWREKESGDRIR